MGIGTLRRYHDDSRVVGETPLPEGAVDAAQEDAAAVAGAQDELENDRKLNEAAATLGHAHAKVQAAYEDGTDADVLDALLADVAKAQESYAAATAAQPAAEEREPIEPGDQPDTAQTTEVRGDPEGDESRGDREPVVTVKADDDERSQGDATPEDGQQAPEAEDDPAGGSDNPGGEEGANDATRVSTAHGDIERPGVTASTDAWINYANADPKGEPFDLAKRPGLRDDLVAHYGA